MLGLVVAMRWAVARMLSRREVCAQAEFFLRLTRNCKVPHRYQLFDVRVKLRGRCKDFAG